MPSLQKPIGLGDSGGFQELVPATTSAGATDAGRLIAANLGGVIDDTFLPTVNSTNLVATEAIAAGLLINLYDNAGTLGTRRADAATGKEAHGYAATGGAAGETIKVVLREGLNAALSGLTAAAVYFLGNNGAVTTTPPTATASIVQKVGQARSATELSFLAGPPVKRA